MPDRVGGRTSAEQGVLGAVRRCGGVNAIVGGKADGLELGESGNDVVWNNLTADIDVAGLVDVVPYRSRVNDGQDVIVTQDFHGAPFVDQGAQSATTTELL